MRARAFAYVVIAATATAAAGACSASATLSELETAERRDRAGDHDGAIAAYRDAQRTCRTVRSRRRSRSACADAFLGEAELLERIGRTADAITRYQGVPDHVPADAATCAIAIHRAGELLLRAGQTEAAWTALWRVVTDWPDEGPAADALRTLLSDGRGRDARALSDQMSLVLISLAETGVADNLLWSLADLAEHELDSPTSARALYDRIPVEHPGSGLRDDARWHAARLSRSLGDPAGAAARLRALLATREVAFGAGSYFSIWLDDAQLELGRVLRDELRDRDGAIRAFERLAVDYPASILKDDALYEIAVTHAAAGRTADACAATSRLAALDPESKYLARSKELCVR